MSTSASGSRESPEPGWRVPRPHSSRASSHAPCRWIVGFTRRGTRPILDALIAVVCCASPTRPGEHRPNGRTGRCLAARVRPSRVIQGALLAPADEVAQGVVPRSGVTSEVGSGRDLQGQRRPVAHPAFQLGRSGDMRDRAAPNAPMRGARSMAGSAQQEWSRSMSPVMRLPVPRTLCGPKSPCTSRGSASRSTTTRSSTTCRAAVRARAGKSGASPRGRWRARSCRRTRPEVREGRPRAGSSERRAAWPEGREPVSHLGASSTGERLAGDEGGQHAGAVGVSLRVG
jgi:hypothetical protein